MPSKVPIIGGDARPAHSDTLYADAPGSAASKKEVTVTVGGETLGAGQSIDGRYRLVRELGRGGMGVVFLADDLRLEREVAIKFLHVHPSQGELNRFRTEARLLASLSHPNVVRVFDLGEHEGRPYFVMEALDGPTLADFLAHEGADGLPVDVAIGFGRQLCEALSAVHRQGIIHRDIKPGNVIVAKGVTAVLMDFGLARTHVVEAERSLVSGTPHYLAPEDIRGEPLVGDDARRSDIYALGVTLFELISGNLPFSGENTAVILDKQLNQAPPHLSDLRPDVPLAFESVILRALQKDPQKRQASCSELIAELSQARSDVVRESTPNLSRSSTNKLAPVAVPRSEPRVLPRRVVLVLSGGPMRERIVDGVRAGLGDIDLRVLPDAPSAATARLPILMALVGSAPGCAVIDLDLLEENPFELCARLRSDPKHSLPVVALADEIAASEEHLLGRMGVEILKKPIDPARLATKIVEVLTPK